MFDKIVAAVCIAICVAADARDCTQRDSLLQRGQVNYTRERIYLP